MALGNYSNNNKNNGPTVYSQYRFSNPDSTVDPSGLRITYWNNTLKISISPKKQTNDDSVVFDHDNQISIYLVHTKARILTEQIKAFMSAPGKFKSKGVNSGSGVIRIADGAEYGLTNPVLVINKLNAETGASEASILYEFRTDNYHYGIDNFDEENFKFDKVYYNNTEIDQFVEVLEQYYKAMTGAFAYSVLQEGSYRMNSMRSTLNSVAEKLGVSTDKKGGNGYKNSGSIFNSNTGNGGNQSNPYSQSSVDDIENELDQM